MTETATYCQGPADPACETYAAHYHAAPNALAPSLQAYLASILDRWVIAKAEADAAFERADALSREVKDACIAAGLQTTTLTDTSGRPVARFEETSGWRLATAKLKAEHPEIYAAYAAQSTTRRLVPVK